MRSMKGLMKSFVILEELYCLQIDYELLNFQEVVKDKRWRHVMEEEINSIKKNDTCELTILPKGH